MQVNNPIKMAQKRKGEWREDWRSRKALLLHGLSSLDFIPPVMEREYQISHSHLYIFYVLSCIMGVGNLGIYFPDLLPPAFQFKVDEFRILLDSEGTRRKLKAIITPPIAGGKCVSFSRH